jgi:tetratricopeptide (TPR) repeat protein
MGDKVKALAYALNILRSHPESMAAEYAGAALVGTNLLRGKIRQARANARLVTRLIPRSPRTAFGIVYLNWYYCYKGQVDKAKELNDEVRRLAKPGTWAFRAARTMSRLIADLEEGRYLQAVERLHSLREVHYVGWFDPIILTFLRRIDWRNTDDPRVRDEIDEVIGVFSELLTGSDPYRSTFARLVLARVYHIQGKIDKAVELLEPLTIKKKKKTGFDPRGYALWNIGRMLARRDPKRAIAILEEYYDGYKHGTGADRSLVILGALYLKSNQDEKALALFKWLDQRLKSGKWMMTANPSYIRAGLAASLLRAGRQEEARKIISPLMEKMARQSDLNLQRQLLGLSIAGFPREAMWVKDEFVRWGRLKDPRATPKRGPEPRIDGPSRGGASADGNKGAEAKTAMPATVGKKQQQQGENR